MTNTINQIRIAAIDAALGEWHAEIENVGGEDRITEYFDLGGPIWQRWLRAQAGCQYGYVYRQGSGVDYCGFFAAWCYAKAGLFLPPFVCGEDKPRLKQGLIINAFPSTYRLDSSERWIKGGSPPAQKIGRHQIEPGDIVVIKTGANKPYGDHVTIALEAPKGGAAGTVATIEGNARGSGPNGIIRGVVKRHREIDRVARVYRLEPHHFETKVI